jgi:hypothetical protein
MNRRRLFYRVRPIVQAPERLTAAPVWNKLALTKCGLRSAESVCRPPIRNPHSTIRIRKEESHGEKTE